MLKNRRVGRFFGLAKPKKSCILFSPYSHMRSHDHTNDDQDIEPVAEEMDTDQDIVLDSEASPQDLVKKLRETVKKLTKEKQEYLEGWQRAKADFVNARKRDEESRKDFVKFAKEDLIAELVPVLDSFEMARANKEQWEKVDANWRTGVEYIHSQLKKTLEQNGLAEINPVGESFDPVRDEAIAYVPVNDESHHHKITEVIQKGYSLAGKSIRPPKVKVGEYIPESQE
jgi:molecular chaperone GrpE